MKRYIITFIVITAAVMAVLQITRKDEVIEMPEVDSVIILDTMVFDTIIPVLSDSVQKPF